MDRTSVLRCRILAPDVLKIGKVDLLAEAAALFGKEKMKSPQQISLASAQSAVYGWITIKAFLGKRTSDLESSLTTNSVRVYTRSSPG